MCDGKCDDAAALQAAINACSGAGGGQLIIPSGTTVLAGPFQLKSNVELHVSAGAKILAHPDERLYTRSAFRDNRGEGMVWIWAENASSIAITGTGIIDGNAVAFMGEERKAAFDLKPTTTLDPRPHVLTLIGCRHLTFRDITFANSAYWCVHLAGCEDVLISDVRIYNNLKVRNSDGIDIDHSKHVRITDCTIESGDDCICLKNRREYAEYGPCEDITVTGCTMTSTSCSVKIGSENVDTIRHVAFSNCIIRNSNRGLGIQNRDEGLVEDIAFENIRVEGRLFDDIWWGKAEPIYITAYKRAPSNHKDGNWRFKKGQTEGQVGPVRNIYFRNLSCKSENGAFIGGEPGMLDNIVLESVELVIKKTTKYPGGCYDRRPCDVDGFVKGSTSGIYLDTAGAVTLHECRIRWEGEIPPYYTHAVDAKNVKVLTIRGSDFKSARKDISVFQLDNTTERGYIRE